MDREGQNCIETGIFLCRPKRFGEPDFKSGEANYTTISKQACIIYRFSLAFSIIFSNLWEESTKCQNMEIRKVKSGITNCYIIGDKNKILIDTGMPGEYDKFTQSLKELNISPKQISWIILTHGHWDHIGNAKMLKDLTGAKIIAHKNDRALIEEGRKFMPPGVTKWGKTLRPVLSLMLKRFSIEATEVDIEINDKDYSLEEFGMKGKIVHTPGHSPGSLSVVLDSGEAFVGDMAMNAIPLTICPALPVFAEDLPLVKTSWRNLISKGVTKIFPAHGDAFMMEKITDQIE